MFLLHLKVNTLLQCSQHYIHQSLNRIVYLGFQLNVTHLQPFLFASIK